MTVLTVRATPQARAYLEEIAAEMATIFSISLDEARGRINHEFGQTQFLTPIEVNVLLHEEQDVWARHIYYGRGSFWWLGEAGLEPQAFTQDDQTSD